MAELYHCKKVDQIAKGKGIIPEISPFLALHTHQENRWLGSF